MADDARAHAVRDLCACETACTLHPACFFVAWNGVLTLVYRGFPCSLARLKQRLAEAETSLGLCGESFGSRWPKTTLGALRDGAPPPSLDELDALKGLCREHNGLLAGMASDVDALSIVSYAARGLERGAGRRLLDAPLAPAADERARLSAPDEAELSIVRRVLSDWDDLREYWPRVAAPGSRIGSYREASPAGQTLVAFVGATPFEPLRRALTAFRAAVDALMPGRFAWLAEDSLHCTVRPLR